MRLNILDTITQITSFNSFLLRVNLRNSCTVSPEAMCESDSNRRILSTTYYISKDIRKKCHGWSSFVSTGAADSLDSTRPKSSAFSYLTVISWQFKCTVSLLSLSDLDLHESVSFQSCLRRHASTGEDVMKYAPNWVCIQVLNSKSGRGRSERWRRLPLFGPSVRSSVSNCCTGKCEQLCDVCFPWHCQWSVYLFLHCLHSASVQSALLCRFSTDWPAHVVSAHCVCPGFRWAQTTTDFFSWKCNFNSHTN